MKLLWLDPKNSYVTIHRLITRDWSCTQCKQYIPKGCVVYHQWLEDQDRENFGYSYNKPLDPYVLLCKECAIEFKYWYRATPPYDSYYFKSVTSQYGCRRTSDTQQFLQRVQCPPDSLCQVLHLTRELLPADPF
jgi:hypothetical protein